MVIYSTIAHSCNSPVDLFFTDYRSRQEDISRTHRAATNSFHERHRPRHSPIMSPLRQQHASIDTRDSAERGTAS